MSQRTAKKGPAPANRKALRCAIYTRKSTEHNLDLEFNSLDAQREACEAYIKSQAHEGWRLLPARYDDGAYSGASLDRPALQSLLAEVQFGAVDVIVVYKVDRLTRSLAGFAKLVELFDQHSVSFVSVTQSFNTTSSMGRLTLNVLLSFAQFEREVIGERVRDKIAASKRKGLWVGGPIPLGYRSVDKKLVVVPEHAERVRMIFKRYLALGSIRALATELDQAGIQTKRRKSDKGPPGVSVPYSVGALRYILTRRFYLGEIIYRGEVARGEHEAIVDPALFEKVQAKLASNAADRKLRQRASPSLLAGRIFDDRGSSMSPTHTNKGGVRYRYYVSQALLQGRPDEAGRVVRVSAPELESAVLQELRQQVQQSRFDQCDVTLSNRDLIEGLLARMVVEPDTLRLQLTLPDLDEAGCVSGDRSGAEHEILVPWSTKQGVLAKGIAYESSTPESGLSASQLTVLTAIAKARNWIDDLVEGRTASWWDIARREGKVERHIRLLAPLAFVPPATIDALLSGRLSRGGIVELAGRTDLLWSSQLGQ